MPAPMRSRMPISTVPDLLVAPVWQAGKTEWSTYLPEGAEWVHVWSGRTFAGGQRRDGSRALRPAAGVLPGGLDFAELFAGLRNL